jgi:hypothetical protein
MLIAVSGESVPSHFQHRIGALVPSTLATCRLFLNDGIFVLIDRAFGVHTSNLQTTRDKGNVSKEPVCRSIVVSGRRKPSDSQHSGLSLLMSGTRSFSFSYGIVVLLRQALELLVQEDEWISRHGLAERLLRLAVLIRDRSSPSQGITTWNFSLSA